MNIQLIHPKTKRIHTVENNPKFVQHLLKAGFMKVDAVTATMVSSTSAPVELPPLNRLDNYISQFKDSIRSLHFEADSDEAEQANEKLFDFLKPYIEAAMKAVDEEEESIETRDRREIIASEILPSIADELASILKPESVDDLLDAALVTAVKEHLALPVFADYLPLPLTTGDNVTDAEEPNKAADASVVNNAQEAEAVPPPNDPSKDKTVSVNPVSGGKGRGGKGSDGSGSKLNPSDPTQQ